MKKTLIFGNSSAGKSTLSKHLSVSQGLAHLDLDTIAWNQGESTTRKPLAESKASIDDFISLHPSWVIEGCYSDLLELLLEHASEVIFMDLPIDTCVENARRRPWEPHKYASKEEQDSNLNMLIEWIKGYETRDDSFSRSAHQRIFEQFSGSKRKVVSNDKSG